MNSQDVIKRSDALKRCEGIRAEIAQLEKEIREYDSKPWDFGTDSVVGSSKCEPYQKHSITISGIYQRPQYAREIESRRNKIMKFKIQLAKQQNDAEDLLETISNPIDRVILRGYYIEGKRWNDVAAELAESTDQDFTEDAIRMRAKRFFEKN